MMTSRISAERLADLRSQSEYIAGAYRSPEANDTSSALAELQQSRALVAELRALAEQIREPFLYQHFVHPEFVDGAQTVRARILVKIEALLAALDAQQAHTEAKS